MELFEIRVERNKAHGLIDLLVRLATCEQS